MQIHQDPMLSHVLYTHPVHNILSLTSRGIAAFISKQAASLKRRSLTASPSKPRKLVEVRSKREEASWSYLFFIHKRGGPKARPGLVQLEVKFEIKSDMASNLSPELKP